MKIENYTVSMKSEHELKLKSAISFESILESPGATEPVHRKNALNEEKGLVERLHFLLIQQLLGLFEQKSCMKFEVAGGRGGERSEVEINNPMVREKGVKVMQTRSEEEKLSVAMKGFVNTDKGSVKLDINLAMSRSFVSSTQLDAGDFVDPLVINFEGSMPQLESTTFSFDIDHDGAKDQISRLSRGNGYLALDRNGNGLIDDGSELFGATTGNGFAELAKYDTDNNCWIDANDAICDGLRIWTNTDGENRLITMAEAGIGAIYLGQSASPFLLKDDTNMTMGRIRSSGVFLYEDGRCGTLAQLDLAKRSKDVQSVSAPLSEALRAL